MENFSRFVNPVPGDIISPEEDPGLFMVYSAALISAAVYSIQAVNVATKQEQQWEAMEFGESGLNKIIRLGDDTITVDENFNRVSKPFGYVRKGAGISYGEFNKYLSSKEGKVFRNLLLLTSDAKDFDKGITRMASMLVQSTGIVYSERDIKIGILSAIENPEIYNEDFIDALAHQVYQKSQHLAHELNMGAIPNPNNRYYTTNSDPASAPPLFRLLSPPDSPLRNTTTLKNPFELSPINIASKILTGTGADSSQATYNQFALLLQEVMGLQKVRPAVSLNDPTLMKILVGTSNVNIDSEQRIVGFLEQIVSGQRGYNRTAGNILPFLIKNHTGDFFADLERELNSFKRNPEEGGQSFKLLVDRLLENQGAFETMSQMYRELSSYSAALAEGTVRTRDPLGKTTIQRLGQTTPEFVSIGRGRLKQDELSQISKLGPNKFIAMDFDTFANNYLAGADSVNYQGEIYKNISSVKVKDMLSKTPDNTLYGGVLVLSAEDLLEIQKARETGQEINLDNIVSNHQSHAVRLLQGQEGGASEALSYIKSHLLTSRDRSGQLLLSIGESPQSKFSGLKAGIFDLSTDKTNSLMATETVLNPSEIFRGAQGNADVLTAFGENKPDYIVIASPRDEQGQLLESSASLGGKVANMGDLHPLYPQGQTKTAIRDALKAGQQVVYSSPNYDEDFHIIKDFLDNPSFRVLSDTIPIEPELPFTVESLAIEAFEEGYGEANIGLATVTNKEQRTHRIGLLDSSFSSPSEQIERLNMMHRLVQEGQSDKIVFFDVETPFNFDNASQILRQGNVVSYNEAIEVYNETVTEGFHQLPLDERKQRFADAAKRRGIIEYSPNRSIKQRLEALEGLAAQLDNAQIVITQTDADWSFIGEEIKLLRTQTKDKKVLAKLKKLQTRFNKALKEKALNSELISTMTGIAPKTSYRQGATMAVRLGAQQMHTSLSDNVFNAVLTDMGLQKLEGGAVSFSSEMEGKGIGAFLYHTRAGRSDLGVAGEFDSPQAVQLLGFSTKHGENKAVLTYKDINTGQTHSLHGEQAVLRSYLYEVADLDTIEGMNAALKTGADTYHDAALQTNYQSVRSLQVRKVRSDVERRLRDLNPLSTSRVRTGRVDELFYVQTNKSARSMTFRNNYLGGKLAMHLEQQGIDISRFNQLYQDAAGSDSPFRPNTMEEFLEGFKFSIARSDGSTATLKIFSANEDFVEFFREAGVTMGDNLNEDEINKARQGLKLHFKDVMSSWHNYQVGVGYAETFQGFGDTLAGLTLDQEKDRSLDYIFASLMGVPPRGEKISEAFPSLSLFYDIRSKEDNFDQQQLRRAVKFDDLTGIIDTETFHELNHLMDETLMYALRDEGTSKVTDRAFNRLASALGYDLKDEGKIGQFRASVGALRKNIQDSLDQAGLDTDFFGATEANPRVASLRNIGATVAGANENFVFIDANGNRRSFNQTADLLLIHDTSATKHIFTARLKELAEDQTEEGATLLNDLATRIEDRMSEKLAGYKAEDLPEGERQGFDVRKQMSAIYDEEVLEFLQVRPDSRGVGMMANPDRLKLFYPQYEPFLFEQIFNEDNTVKNANQVQKILDILDSENGMDFEKVLRDRLYDPNLKEPLTVEEKHAVLNNTIDEYHSGANQPPRTASTVKLHTSVSEATSTPDTSGSTVKNMHEAAQAPNPSRSAVSKSVHDSLSDMPVADTQISAAGIIIGGLMMLGLSTPNVENADDERKERLQMVRRNEAAPGFDAPGPGPVSVFDPSQGSMSVKISARFKDKRNRDLTVKQYFNRYSGVFVPSSYEALEPPEISPTTTELLRESMRIM